MDTTNPPIAFIAPYEDMQRMAWELIEEFSFPARAYLGDHQLGVAATRQALRDGAKIIISRGCTAGLIRSQLGIEVVEVGGCAYSVMSSLLKHTTASSRIAVASFPRFVSIASGVCDVLGREYEVFAVEVSGSAEETFAKVRAWKPDVVIGDVACVRLAQDEGIPAYLIDSSRENVLAALEQAMQVHENLQRHLANAQKLTTVLNCAQQGVLLVGDDRCIEESNKFAGELLGLEHDQLMGRQLREFFDSTELDAVLSAGTEARDIIVSYNDTRLVLSALRFQGEGVARGRVILMQPLVQIQETEKSIRKKLLQSGFYARHTFESIECASREMREVVDTAREYAKTSCNIMIYGETGTGKELFAQSIHNAGPLARGPFVAVNCAALPGPLLESELFGYAPGAFTGASRTGKAGLFEMAHDGTLFLDEITEMDPSLQSRLLRAIQEHEIMRVGDDRMIPVKVRIIAATNRPPEEAIHRGKLRADVFFRINVLNLNLPPLRCRVEDVPLLFLRFIDIYARKYDLAPPQPSQRYRDLLKAHLWPGNARELENLAEKFVVLGGHEERCLPFAFGWPGEAGMDDMAVAAGAGEGTGGSTDHLEHVIQAHMEKIVREEGGNISQAARRLGVDRNTVRRRCKI